VVAIILLVGCLLLTIVLRLLRWIVRGSPLGSRIESLQQRAANSWTTQSGRANPEVVAELFLFAAIAASIVVIATYGRFLPALWGEDKEPLSCTFRDAHTAYTFAMAVLITAITAGRQLVSNFLSRREASNASITLANWGSASLIFLLVMILTAPWRVLYNNFLPMATLNGAPVFVLMEKGPSIVLYDAKQHVTLEYRTGEDTGLARLNKTEHVFGPAGCK
jgi:hypothetical protein